MRNKIFVTNVIPDDIQDIYSTIDIGNILANAYKTNPKNFEAEAKFNSFSYFRKILEKFIDKTKTRILFCNIGILLEKDFSLDVSRFLLDFAKDYQVFLDLTHLRIENGNTLVWNIEKPENKIEFDSGVLERASF